ncbi:MAG: hypothetical protein CVV24_07685 [Ignavibacteriae bacterium HGW-Ignavibacteriae-3]|nr:MAG: hypothetical protein CVV24_07685 [Ignavibacteriae bacterium HGW-Ignavibacteriae-3]
MIKISNSKKFYYSILTVIVLALIAGCVESLTDTQNTTTPSIEVVSPKSNDSVMVGRNVINYLSGDGTDGGGLSFYELYVNKIFTKKYEQGTGNSNPVIYLDIDSTLINTRISYSVKVYNKIGKTKESRLQENIFVKDKIPRAPQNLVLARLGENSVILKWDPYTAQNAAGLQLWRKDVVNGVTIPFRIIKSLPVNQLSYTDGNLSQYQEYSYYVTAYNGSGMAASNIVSTSSLPGGPWNLQAEAIGSSSVHLQWVDIAVNETAFQIERTDPSSNVFKIIKITEGPNITEYYDNSVSPSIAYSYRVAYFTPTTMSGYSNTATVTTFHTDVLAPTELSASYVSGGVQISWKDNSQTLSKGTVVERRIGETGNFIVIGTAAVGLTSFIDNSPVTGYSYYRVRHILGTKTYTPYSNLLKVLY